MFSPRCRWNSFIWNWLWAIRITSDTTGDFWFEESILIWWWYTKIRMSFAQLCRTHCWASWKPFSVWFSCSSCVVALTWTFRSGQLRDICPTFPHLKHLPSAFALSRSIFNPCPPYVMPVPIFIWGTAVGVSGLRVMFGRYGENWEEQVDCIQGRWLCHVLLCGGGG